MGRAKRSMELISKEKSRNKTFKTRKEGLVRKMHEFTTLCDVNACMIIYGPKQERGVVEPEIWPQNHDQVHRIIDIYKAKNKDSGIKTFGLSDFFHDRRRKIEEELTKLRKKNMEAKYPSWLEDLNSMVEVQLRDFAASLSNKAEYVKSRIEFLRRKKEGLDMSLMDFTQSRLSHQSHNFISPGVRGIDQLEVINQQAFPSVRPFEMHVPMHYPPVDHHQVLHSVNPNSMMMLLMNDNDHSGQFGSASTSSNIQCASFKRQVFYESSSSVGGLGHGHGVVDPMICYNPGPLAGYNPPPYMMPAVAPPQLPFTIRENRDGGQEDIVQYYKENH